MGQESLKAVYRFVAFNSEWLQHALGVEPVVMANETRQKLSSDQPQAPVKMIPWSESTFRQLCPRQLASQIGMYTVYFDGVDKKGN